MNIAITLHSSRFKSQLSLLSKLLENVSKARRRKILRDLLCLLSGLVVSPVTGNKHGAAAGAGDFAFEIFIPGLDELIVAALRASKGKGFLDV
jgi:hypothetical protein